MGFVCRHLCCTCNCSLDGLVEIGFVCCDDLSDHMVASSLVCGER